MANYATRADLNNMYGKINIDIWADLDNNKVGSDVSARVTWALEQATEYINSRLVNGKYEIPFATPPKFIVFLTTLYAGLILYDGRQMINATTPRDQLSRQRNTFKVYMRQLLGGQIKLLDATSGDAIESTCETHISAVTIEDDPDYVAVDDPCDCE